MFQIRSKNLDKSLGLFWDGNKFSSLASAKTFSSHREAAKEAANITYSIGFNVEIVNQVTTSEQATSQSNNVKQRFSSIEPSEETLQSASEISRKQHGKFR